MSRFLMCGWEMNDPQQIGTLVYNWNDPYTTSYQPRSGNYCLVCSPNDEPAFTGVMVPHATQTELYYAFGLYRDTWETTEAPVLCFCALDSAAACGIGLGVGQDGTLRIMRGTAGGSRPLYAGPSQWADLGAAAGILPMWAWVLIEVHIIAATDATGTVEVRVNSVPTLSVTSVQTCQTNADLSAFRIEFYRPVPTIGDSGSEFHFDDLRVNTTAGTANNSWCGDGSIRGLSPTGVGTTIGGTALSPVGGSTNWQNVDDRPPDSGDYNTGTVVGTGETYALTDPPPTVATCQAVNVIVSAFSPVAGGAVGITTRSGGSLSEGTAIPVGSFPLYYNRLMENNPDTGAPWTQSALNALEAGITIR